MSGSRISELCVPAKPEKNAFLDLDVTVCTVLVMESVIGVRPASPFEARQPTPWARTTGLAAVLDGWQPDSGSKLAGTGFVLCRTLSGQEGSTVAIPDHLAPPVKDALRQLGIAALYSHQQDAIRLAREGRDVVVATPTASGKSLCYHVPVLDAFARDERACAMYLFPTKALCRDQEFGMHRLMRAAGLGRGAITYDGDTPADARRVAREKAGVLLTNPDMLHASILPHHSAWTRVFSNLRYVVIDELHTYRGVFGSHLANVLRRLQRVAAFHGSNPVFLSASATIGNPREHASRLLGRDVALVRESGAPTGRRHVRIFNPPFIQRELNLRQSYLKTAVRLTAELIRAQVPTLLFGQSRNGVEVMLKYLRDRLAGDPIPPDSIVAYRGGYLPETRRRIEGGLRNGEVRCVVATNALELGIDIGSLQAVVCAGYPGTMAGLWQRFGRGGRSQDESLCVLVPSSLPLDQYMVADPERVLNDAVEQARCDPDNIEILLQHLKCAAFEIPFSEDDRFGSMDAAALGEALAFMADRGLLHAGVGESGKRAYHWANQAYPANFVSLRSVTSDNFVIIDLAFDKTIAELDWRSAHTALHEQAIYQHEGAQFQVERLDYENRKAFVRRVKPDYYTTAMTHRKVAVLDEVDASPLWSGAPTGAGCQSRESAGQLMVGHGDVQVLQRVVGYKKIKFHTHENCGYGDVHLPQMEMHTTSCWFVFPREQLRTLGTRAEVQELLCGLMNALHTVAVAGLMVDGRDLGRELNDRSDDGLPPGRGAPETADVGERWNHDPTIFLYDQITGGIGLAARLFEVRETLMSRAGMLIRDCPCDSGCPACVGIADLDPSPSGLEPRGARRAQSRKGRVERLVRRFAS